MSEYEELIFQININIFEQVKLLVPSIKRQYAHKNIKILLRKEKKRKENDLRVSHKMKNKRLFECRKVYYEMQKNNCKVAFIRSLVLAIRVEKYAAKQGQPRILFLAERVEEKAEILGPPDTFEINYLEIF